MHLSTRAILATTACGTALLALLVGDPGRPQPSRPVTVPRELSWVQEYDEARIDAVTVAEWLRDRRASLSILDVRTEAAYADFHLPRAVHAPLPTLDDVLLDSGATIVAYGNEPSDAQRAWLVLRAFGHPNVRALEGGIRGWLVDVINPVIPRPTTPAEQVEFDRRADLSRYFGGVPRLGQAADASESADAVLTRTRRRGCAF